MRLVVALLVLAAAGGAAWMLLRPSERVGDVGVDYVFDVETNEVVQVKTISGADVIAGIEPVGVIGEVARPVGNLAEPDRWIAEAIRLPRQDVVTGKELLHAMGRLVPIRFRSREELERFEKFDFEFNLDPTDQVEGTVFESLVQHVGFRMATRERFLFIHDPTGDDAFRERLLSRRARAGKKRNEPKTPK